METKRRLIRRPTQAHWQGFIGTQRFRTLRVAELLVNGKISPRQFGDRLKRILVSGHADAWVLGRMRAGDMNPFSFEDHLVGQAVADADDDYLLGFIEALQDGKLNDENGSLDIEKLLRRTSLYVNKFRGTANEAFTQTGADTDEFAWRMGGVEHCDDCPQLAALSPYTKDTMMHQPGDGQTECKTECWCYWVNMTTGVRGFKKSPVKESTPGRYDVGRPGELGNAEFGPTVHPRANFDLDQAGGVAGEMVAALDRIGRVHSLPQVDAIPVEGFFQLFTGLRGAFHYWPHAPEMAGIAINGAGEMPAAVLIHEIGHVIDIFFMGGMSGKSIVHSDARFSAFRKAVLKSEALKRQREFRTSAFVDVEAEDGRIARIPVGETERSHAQYLRIWAELWARAYFQFVVIRSKDRALKEMLQDLQESKEGRLFLSQWAAEDFKAIEQAVEDVLRGEGWM